MSALGCHTAMDEGGPDALRGPRRTSPVRPHAYTGGGDDSGRSGRTKGGVDRIVLGDAPPSGKPRESFTSALSSLERAIKKRITDHAARVSDDLHRRRARPSTPVHPTVATGARPPTPGAWSAACGFGITDGFDTTSESIGCILTISRIKLPASQTNLLTLTLGVQITLAWSELWSSNNIGVP